MSGGLKELLKEAIEEGKTLDVDKIAKEVKKMVSEDEEVKKEITLTEEMVFNVKIGDTIKMGMKIKGDELSVDDVSDEPDFFIDIPKKTLSEIISGEKDVMSPFMGGEIVMWREGEAGDASKAMDILPLITIFTEKVGLKM